MGRKRTVIVIPSHRKDRFLVWHKKWRKTFHDHQIILIEDSPQRSFRVRSDNLEHFSWREIDKDFGKDAWIIPRHSAAIRSYGFYRAFQSGADVVVTLDDDCFPLAADLVDKHQYYLYRHRYFDGWVQHAQIPLRVRGTPQQLSRVEVVANMGLWGNVPDLDGITQKRHPRFRIKRAQDFNFLIPSNQFAPISSMNLAVKREVIPACYFLLMGPGYPFDRFDDIWAGLFLKKICDHLEKYIAGGEPSVWHERASDVDENIKKEKTGLMVNEYLWKDLVRIQLSGNNFKNCYIDLASKLPIYKEYSSYWKKLSLAMKVWANLF